MNLDRSDLDKRPAAEDWYVEAARVVRLEFHGDSPRKFQTEQRLLSAAQPLLLRRLIVWLLPGLALLGGSVAWAAGGPRLSRWMHALEELTGARVAAPPIAEADKPQRVAYAEQREHPAARVEGESSATPASVPTQAVTPSVREVRAPVRLVEAVPTKAAKNSTALASPPLPPPPHADDDLTLYRAAHVAHFVQADWSAALVAWDRYLERPGVGRFLPEARFNRALALARLGRAAEAREALRPFAGGVYGSYHQEEAQRLLKQLAATE